MAQELTTKHTFPLTGLLGAALILAATVLAYLPDLHNGFIWDDDRYVTNNQTLRSGAGLGAIWTNPTANSQYYPLVFTTFWIEYHLWDLTPVGYHLVNVLLHAAAAIVLWRLLRRLNVPGAFLAGLIFAVHPVHVESVAWVTERKNVLSGLLYLLAAAAYLRFAPPENHQRRWGFYALAVALFIGALLSKTVTCTLPAALLLVLWWKRPKLSLRDFLPLAPLLVVGVALGLFTAHLEKVHVKAIGEDWAFTIPQRLLIAGQAVWFYASKIVWPHPLAFIYPRWAINQAAGWQYVFPISAALIVIVLLLARRRTGKAPAVAVLFFAGTLFPALGFVNVYPMRFSFVADHFQYLASIGLIALGGSLLWRWGQRLAHRGRPGRWAAVAVAAALVIALGATTWQQTKVYRGEESLWLDTLTKNPDCWVAHTNLGDIYSDADFRDAAAGDQAAAHADAEKAAFHYLRAAQLRSDFPESVYNLGASYARLGRHAEAVELFRRALSLPTVFSIPNYEAVVHMTMAASRVHLNRIDEAAAEYREAIRLDPNNIEAYNNLGVILQQQGHLDEAEALFRKALVMHPDTCELQENLGTVLEAHGDLAGAAGCYRAALALQPAKGITHRRLAFVLARMGMVEPALEEFRESVQLIGPDEQAAAELVKILKAAATEPAKNPAK